MRSQQKTHTKPHALKAKKECKKTRPNTQRSATLSTISIPHIHLKTKRGLSSRKRSSSEDDTQDSHALELDVLLNSVGADTRLGSDEYSIQPVSPNEQKIRTADDVADVSIDTLMGSKPRENPYGYTKGDVDKKTNKRQQKKVDEMFQQQYGQFVNMNDDGAGLVWAGNIEQDAQNPAAHPASEPAPTHLHEQIIQLYLENYDQQEDRELEANFDRKELQHQRDQFISALVNTFSPKTYARFVHFFRICIQRMRTLLIKNQHAKEALAKNIHLYVSVSKQQSSMNKQYLQDVQEVKVQFFRQASRLFAEHSDTFMPQLVIYLSSLTLKQLEQARERQTTASMNPYSCGFWSEEDAASFKAQFRDYLTATNVAVDSTDFKDQYDENGNLIQVNHTKKRLIDATFPVPMANKLYSSLDIHTDMSSPLLWSRLERIHKKSHKVFVSNIPSTLTTRELMTLFGNCGILNAAEIYREHYIYGSDEQDDITFDPTANAELLHKQQQEDLLQGISISKREALLQANAAALTVDIADLSLGHFTSSFKTDKVLVPSHVLDSNKLQTTINNYFKSQELLLAQDSSPQLKVGGQGSGITQQYDENGEPIDNAHDMYHNTSFNETVQQSFNMELHKFEQQHMKKMQRQQKKLQEAIQSGTVNANEIHAEELGLTNDVINVDQLNSNVDTVGEKLTANELPGVNTPYTEGPHQNFKAQQQQQQEQKPKGVTDQLLQFNFKLKSQNPNSLRDKLAIHDHNSPVCGFLYFATKDGKDRALKQALQIFGVSTASGYAMTTSDASLKKQLIISNIHRSMTSSDVAHYVRETLQPHMSLTRAVKEDGKAIALNASAQTLAIGGEPHEASLNDGDTRETVSNKISRDEILKTSILERVYLPRSFNRIGGNIKRGGAGDDTLFNINRGYAIISFDSHDTAFTAFKHLNSAVLSPDTFISQTRNQHNLHNNAPNKVEEINSNFDVSSSFGNEPTPFDNSSPYHQPRNIKVHWRKDKIRPRKPSHPVTSFFPTFERPKSSLYLQVNQQLKEAFDQNINIKTIQ